MQKWVTDTYVARLDRWLSEKSQISRAQIQKAIADGRVQLSTKKHPKASMELDVGVEVSLECIEILPPKACSLPLDIRYEDDYLVVVNKPVGMMVHPSSRQETDTLVNGLLAHTYLSSGTSLERPGVVHRLDKDTSGLLVLAKTKEAEEAMIALFAARKVARWYEGIIQGVIETQSGTVDQPLGRDPKHRTRIAVVETGRKAVTHYQRLAYNEELSLLQFKLETGRMHQIRVHMAYLGYPLLGDGIYGKKDTHYGFQGQALHAYRLAFQHPITGDELTFSAPGPEHFESVKQKIQGGGTGAK